MKKLRLLDLFSGAGGAAMGYFQAGFSEIVGVDIKPQKRYPFTFVQGDALEYLAAHGHEFDAIHASPPCQAFTLLQRVRKREHPDLLAATREALRATGRPYVIENVPGAPLENAIWLEGHLFGLRTYRPRGFECSFDVPQPAIPPRSAPNAKLGRPVKSGEFIQVAGNFSDVKMARRAMGIDWMVRDELREAIPPAYCQFIGERLLQQARTALSAVAVEGEL